MNTKRIVDAFWRAGAYCLHPKVVAWSLLPLALGVALALGLGWFFWEPAVAAVRDGLARWSLVDAALKWVEGVFGASFRTVVAPLVVIALAAPLIVVVSVLLVALLMTPAIVRLVVARRFPTLEARRGAGTFTSVAWALGHTLVALVLLVMSMPLWLIPPLVMVLPPLIGGWLTDRVMAFDALAEHASRDERRAILREHRGPLLAIGVVCGFLGAAPSLLWAASVVTVIFAPVVIAASIWLYMLVFAFASLWFTHYALSVLAERRHAEAASQFMPPAASATAAVVDALLPARTTASSDSAMPASAVAGSVAGGAAALPSPTPPAVEPPRR